MLLAVLAVGVSSFTLKDYKSNAFAEVCFKLKTGLPANDPNSWEPIVGSTCNDGDIFCAVCIPEEFLIEGLPSEDALSYYASFNDEEHNTSFQIPANGGTTAYLVTIKQKSTTP